MLQNRLINWTDIIQFTSAGIVVADYSQVREAISSRFKQIYGSDIDLSTASADGIYVETLSLLVNNICQSFKSFYSSLDVRTATGKSLEMLCALSNVSRKAATYSTASIECTLSSEETTDLTTRSISFLDKNGNEWKCETPNSDMVFEPDVPQSIIVTCTQAGPVRADVGWIDRTLDTQVVMTVVQSQPAQLGSYAETDAQLRARRNQSLGATGNSVLESLAGALLSVTGIDDVKIYNNDTSQPVVTKDTTSIDAHNVYVIVRRRENVAIANSLLGSLIYQKMTPGIMTTSFSGSSSNGINQTYRYRQYVLGEEVDPDLIQNVSWKEAVAIHPQIAIKVKAKENFASSNDSTLSKIANTLFEYLNNLPISTDITLENVKDESEYADPMFRGRTTYDVQSVTIDGNAADFTNQDTYFSYTNATYTNNNDGTYTVTLS